MTREEALLFQARWKLANERIAEEIRNTPAETKLRQLAMMFEAGVALAWSERMSHDDEEIYQRWQLLRERMRHRPHPA